MKVAIYMIDDFLNQSADSCVIELRQLCRKNGWEVVGEYVDTTSGVEKSDGHIELYRLLVNAHRRKFHKVVVWDISRVGLSVRHLLVVLSQLRDKGIDVHSYKQSANISILNFMCSMVVPAYRSLKLVKMDLIGFQQSIYDYYYLKIKKKSVYIRQTEHYGIGNFINCTPAIIELSRHYGHKINVLFDSDNVARMYENCEYIRISKQDEVLDKYLLFDSSLINKEIEDWKFIHTSISRRLDIQADSIPHTYVDVVNYRPYDEKYCVIVRGGALNDEWLELKDPGDDIYKTIIETIGRSYKIVFVGTDVDYHRFISKMESWCDSSIAILNDVRKTLGALNNASFVVTNDTGMYHASCALGSETFALWKDTWFVKNKAPGNFCTYAFEDNWSAEFDDWYKEITGGNT